MSTNISISKIKTRRGTDEQRKSVVLDQGELGYTIDTKRLFVGTGTLSGGAVIGSKLHPPLTNLYSLTSLNAQVGDGVYVDSLMFQLTATDYTDINSWTNIGTVVDNTSIEYNNNNKLSLKDGGIDTVHLNSNIAQTGLIIDGSGIHVQLTDLFELSSNHITIASNSITSDLISTSAFYISGGISNHPVNGITLNIGDSFIIDETNTLQLCSLPSSLYSIDPSTIGSGLSLSAGKLTSNVIGGDGITTTVTPAKKISLITRFSGITGQELPYLEYDKYGLPLDIQTSIYSTLTGIGEENTNDNVPIGTILPHAAAIGQIPDGYLLCSGTSLLSTDYTDLFEVIGTTYGSIGVNNFNLPDLNNAILAGSEIVPDYGSSIFLDDHGSGSLSAVPVNYIIKATNISPTNNIFNGSPGQITNNNQPDSVFIYNTIDSNGNTISLSSAGFITFQGDVKTRGDDTQVDRFAIPVFNY